MGGPPLGLLGLLPDGAHEARFDCAVGTCAAGGNFSHLDAPSFPLGPLDASSFNSVTILQTCTGSYPVGLATFLLREVRARLGDATGIPLTLSQIAALPELSRADDIRARGLEAQAIRLERSGAPPARGRAHSIRGPDSVPPPLLRALRPRHRELLAR